MKKQLNNLFKEHNIKEFVIESFPEREISLEQITFNDCPEYIKIKYELSGLYRYIRLSRNMTISAYYTSEYYADTFALKLSDYEFYRDIIKDFFKIHYDILKYGKYEETVNISPRYKIKLFKTVDFYTFMKM